jgi:hypothetical protein
MLPDEKSFNSPPYDEVVGHFGSHHDMPKGDQLCMPDGVLRLPIGNHFVSRSRIS